MRIDKLNTTNFTAGNVSLDKITPENFHSYSSIKKLAEDKEIDVFISKNSESKHLPKEDVYLVIASKEQPVVERSFFHIGNNSTEAADILFLDKKANKKEVSVKLFNTVMKAIDTLDNKLKIKI
jgi:DNA-binding protein Fis